MLNVAKLSGLLIVCHLAGWPASAQVTPPSAAEPLFEGLGSHQHPITTSSPRAQQWFDQGLAFLYGFNHDEAARCFTRAAELDAKSPMVFWGIAMANGPHINRPVVDEARAQAAWTALQKALAISDAGKPVERALIKAAAARYANPQPKDRSGLDRAYADALREVWKAFPQDTDVGVLFAESLMDLRPWNLWDEKGQPRAETSEALATLERVLALDPGHPQGLHLTIHALEASPSPQEAEAAANRLRLAVPGIGHMLHMASHIDIRLGHWKEAVAANERAIDSDRTYSRRRPLQGFQYVYAAHNRHMLAYAAMMRGQSGRAMRAIDELVAGIPAELIKVAAARLDWFMAMPFEVRKRFGKWDEVLSLPEPAETFPAARAMRHAARGVAFAATGRLDEARSEQALYQEAKGRISPEAFAFNNKMQDAVAVAGHLLAGEIALRKGALDDAIAALRAGVKAEDGLRYFEPPIWTQPVRHALGAVLLGAHRYREAEAVYREDLVLHPDNGWSLFGLAAALDGLDRSAEAKEVRKKFQQAWADADFELTSSCLCITARASFE